MSVSIRSAYKQVAAEQNRAFAPPQDELPLLDSGLNSLCLPVVIARLEHLLGVDSLSSLPILLSLLL